MNSLIYLTTANGAGTSYAGDPNNGLYIFGAQMEPSSAAGFYVPTAAAAVTKGPSQKWAVGVTANHSLPWSTSADRPLYTVGGTSGAGAHYLRLYTDGFSYFDVFDGENIMRRVAPLLATYPAATKTFTAESNSGRLSVYADGVKVSGVMSGAGRGDVQELRSPIYLGAYGATSATFNGTISRIAQALTAEGVKP
jgi:hypothetical protein